jgi:nitroreductase
VCFGSILPMPTPAPKRADTSVPLHPLLEERWSPRGFDRTHRLSDDELASLLEAARWTASASNTQPWRLLPTRRGDVAFERLAGTLAEGNRVWAAHASALILVATSLRNDDGDALRWAWYDAGQAAALMTVQALHLGLAVHQMGGFDVAAVRTEFTLPDDIEPIAVAAIGRWDPDVDLPPSLQERESAPRARRPLSEIVWRS